MGKPSSSFQAGLLCNFGRYSLDQQFFAVSGLHDILYLMDATTLGKGKVQSRINYFWINAIGLNGAGKLGEPMYMFWIHELSLHLVPRKYETTHTKAPPTLGLTPNPGLHHTRLSSILGSITWLGLTPKVGSPITSLFQSWAPPFQAPSILGSPQLRLP